MHSEQNSAKPHFGDQLHAAINAVGNPLCVGLDLHLSKIPKVFFRATDTSLKALRAFCGEVIAAVASKVAVIKPQMAFFESLGSGGLELLRFVVTTAREYGLLVILDAKRGDIGSTAEAYANAYLTPDTYIEADAMTVNPYLGMDSIDPFIRACREHGKGLFVLVKTSNEGSYDIQNLKSGEYTVYEHVARRLRTRADDLRGATGWSSLGVVCGATFPDEALAVRKQLPNSPLLIPGYGAQGANATEACTPFMFPSKDGKHRTGGIVNSSRGILFPQGVDEVSYVGDYRKLIRQSVDKAIAELRKATEVPS